VNPELLIATNNPGKLAELRAMLGDLKLILRSLVEIEGITDVAETGATFAENARIKAMGYSRQTFLTALADDSGLEIASLAGQPGVFSARYGGETWSFEHRMRKILAELSDVPDRSAQFACSMAIASPAGVILHESTGICRGHIALSPIGSEGFGYDPIFIPDGYDRTFGELPPAIKDKISHRARAFLQIIPFLRDFSSKMT